MISQGGGFSGGEQIKQVGLELGGEREEQEASCWGSLRDDHAGREHAQPCLTPYEVCVTAQSEDCQKKYEVFFSEHFRKSGQLSSCNGYSQIY